MADISAFDYDVMGLCPVSLQNEWLFEDIPSTAKNLDKYVAKTTESEIVRISGNTLSFGSAGDGGGMCKNIAVVNVD